MKINREIKLPYLRRVRTTLGVIADKNTLDEQPGVYSLRYHRLRRSNTIYWDLVNRG